MELKTLPADVGSAQPKYRWRSFGLLMVLVVATAGCSYHTTFGTLLSSYDGTLMKMRATRQARIAYRRCHSCKRGLLVRNSDLENGFVDGYVAAASGGRSHPPLFAPARTTLGLQTAPSSQDYFQGYSLGSVEAEKCGANRLHHAAMNPTLQAWVNQRQDGCDPGCATCQATLASQQMIQDFTVDSPSSEAVGSGYLEPEATTTDGDRPAFTAPEQSTPAPAPTPDPSTQGFWNSSSTLIDSIEQMDSPFTRIDVVNHTDSTAIADVLEAASDDLAPDDYALIDDWDEISSEQEQPKGDGGVVTMAEPQFWSETKSKKTAK